MMIFGGRTDQDRAFLEHTNELAKVIGTPAPQVDEKGLVLPTDKELWMDWFHDGPDPCAEGDDVKAWCASVIGKHAREIAGQSARAQKAVCDAHEAAVLKEADELWNRVVLERCGSIHHGAVLGDIIAARLAGKERDRE